MPYFRIAAIPRGQAPEEVRREWIGVTLPFDIPQGESHERNFNGDRQPTRPFVTAPACIALAELAKKSPGAAQWFYNNLPRSFLQNGNFSFGTSELEIIQLRVGDS